MDQQLRRFEDVASIHEGGQGLPVVFLHGQIAKDGNRDQVIGRLFCGETVDHQNRLALDHALGDPGKIGGIKARKGRRRPEEIQPEG